MLFRYFHFTKKPVIQMPVSGWASYDGRYNAAPAQLAASVVYPAMVTLAAGRLLLAYRRTNSNDVVLRTVSLLANGSLQWGNEIIAYIGSVTALALTVDVSSGRGVLMVRSSPYNYPKVCAFKIDASLTMTIGVSTQLVAGAMQYPSMVMADATHVVAAFQSTKDNMGQIVVGTIDSNTLNIIWGTRFNFELNAKPTHISLIRQSASQLLLLYRSGLAGNKAKAQVIQLVANTPTIQTAVDVTSTAVSAVAGVGVAADKALVLYRHQARMTGEVVPISVNGTVISVGSPLVFQQETSALSIVDMVVASPLLPYGAVIYSLNTPQLKMAVFDYGTSVLKLLRTVDLRSSPDNADMLAVGVLSNAKLLLAFHNSYLGDLGQFISLNNAG